MKLIECISQVDLNPKSSTTSSILRHIGKHKLKIKIKLKGKK